MSALLKLNTIAVRTYRSWLDLAVLVKNVAEQKLHSNGCSPMWRTRSCRRARYLVTNRLSQNVHGKFFSPVWRTICVFRLYGVLKTLPHLGHTRDCIFRAVLFAGGTFSAATSSGANERGFTTLIEGYVVSSLRSVPICIKFPFFGLFASTFLGKFSFANEGVSINGFLCLNIKGDSES